MRVQQSGYPMERIAIDILGELPETDNENRYIVVISDYYTKWTESHPMQNMEASTLANILMTQVISRFGVPSVIHSDQGSQFESQLFLVRCASCFRSRRPEQPLIIRNRMEWLRGSTKRLQPC